MLSNFVLIDLVSQREAVRAFLQDVDIPARLAWLESWGRLETIDQRSALGLTYFFESRFGFTAGFFFDDGGDFVFLGDQTTFR